MKGKKSVRETRTTSPVLWSAARSGALYIVFAIVSLACKSRPETEKTPAQVASSLVDDVSPLDTASALPLPAQQEPWDPALCDVAPEPDKGASFSDLTFAGTCPFRHRGPATCRARGDDYYAIIRRKLRDGNEVELYINVEYYTGPGTYEKKAETLVLIRRGQSLYRWSNQQGTLTLGFGEGGMSAASKRATQAQAGTPTLVDLATTDLAAEPGTPTRGTIVVSGTIGCVLKAPPGG
jgi:hypothetical protein